jgi:RND family efflux transporter MFP subunit
MKHTKGCLWGVFLLLAGGALALLVLVRATETEVATSLEEIERAEGVSVVVEKPMRRDFTSYLYCDGHVAAARRYFLRARVGEVVEEVLVDRGEIVEEGQLLATFRREDIEARIDASRAAFEEAQANYERYTNLFEKGVVSADVVDARKTAKENAAAALRQARTQLKYTEVHSPAGEPRAAGGSVQVAGRFVDPGEFKGVGKPLFSLIDLSRVDVQVLVPAGGVGGLSADQVLEFRLEEEENWRTGTVRRISPSTESPNRFFDVYLNLENERREGVWQMRPGMYAEVRIPVETIEEALSVRGSVVVWEGRRQYVFRVQESEEEVPVVVEKKKPPQGIVARLRRWIGGDEGGEPEESVVRRTRTEKVLRAERVEVQTGLRRKGHVQLMGDEVGTVDRVVCSPRVDMREGARLKIVGESCGQKEGGGQ